jgi:hypothetical protein
MNASIVPGAKNHLPGNSTQKVEALRSGPAAVGPDIATEKAELRGRIRQAFLNNILFFLTGEPTQQDAQKTARRSTRARTRGSCSSRAPTRSSPTRASTRWSTSSCYEMQVQGIIEPPPEDLHQDDGRGGVRAEVHVEYINNLAAAQKLLGISRSSG